MNDHERFADLWTDYLEGELDAPGIAELQGLLATDERLVERAAELYQTHRLLGLVVEETPSRQDDFVSDVLARLPEDSNRFVSGVMADVGRLSESPAKERAMVGRESTPHTAAPQTATNWIPVSVAAVVVITFAVLGFSLWPMKNQGGVQDGDGNLAESATDIDVRIASLAHAKFFGELLPAVNSVLSAERDYVLLSGLVEVQFPAGASAIVEGPAVFRVLSDDCLALDVGRCSVHTPDGAEGFRVETPVTRVVDRGTRFTVNVDETSETEVHVVEGVADIYERSRTERRAADSVDDEIRLTNGEARKFAKGRAFATDTIPFDASTYRRGLPDRVVSYRATKAADGGVENLLSVTVQRDGRMMEIAVDDLIPSRVTAFNVTSPGAFVCGGETLPEHRVSTSSDHSLVTGVINPGGAVEPLRSDPVLSGESATPGLAIRFDEPVENGPGADVVFFDLQTVANPSGGDAFHVSPLSFRGGRKSHTIRVYDLTMESPDARDLTSFHVHLFDEAATSLTKLESLSGSPRKQVIQFRGLVVGIDLSDLGFATGETVEGLFIQDAMDDKHYVDPVFIGGLPVSK